MKRSILIAVVLFAVVGLVNLGIAATGWNCQWEVVTTTGVTGFSLAAVTQEVYVVMGSTNPVYINWVSSTAVDTTNFAMGTVDQTDIIEHTEEVRSSYFSVRADTPPVHIRFQFKW